MEEAEALMKRSRPTVGLNITQKAFLSLYLQEMEKKRGGFREMGMLVIFCLFVCFILLLSFWY